MAIHSKNPTNGYVESTSLPFLWCLLFGSLYFAIKGIWSHAFVSFVLALCTGWVSWLIYPFFARGIIYKAYARKGWVEIGGARHEQPTQSVAPVREEPKLIA